MKIIEVTEYSEATEKAILRLLPQLSASAKRPTTAEIKDLIRGEASILLMAVEEDQGSAAAGMLTLAVFRIPTGVRAWIEDVVVDEDSRGQGIGERLVQAAIERAKTAGAITVDLTSRPSREAANRLYRRCGFVQRETNIYRLSIES